MTTKEKIEALDNLIGMVDDNHGTDYDEALKSAKRSLEAWDKVKTNGDVINMVFPNCKVIILADRTVSVKYKEHGCWVHYEFDWWNAPYKESEDKE